MSEYAEYHDVDVPLPSKFFLFPYFFSDIDVNPSGKLTGPIPWPELLVFNTRFVSTVEQPQELVYPLSAKVRNTILIVMSNLKHRPPMTYTYVTIT